MPWKAFKRGDQFKVYKINAVGEPVGDALGTHDTEAEASAQVRALYANEPGAKAVKFAEGSNTEIVGLLAPFGGPFNGRDISGEFFSPNTDFVLDWFDTRPLLYHHGLDGKTGVSVIGRIKTLTTDDLGLWMRAQLDARHEYYSAIKDLIKQGSLGLSSGSMRHLVEVNKKTGEILRWPLIEGSATPTESNPLAEVGFAEAKSHFKAIGIELPDTEDALKAELTSKRREALSEDDFAYIDSEGGKHLPMHDKVHAQNALARFNQTDFESNEAKAKARKRLVARAKELGIEVSEDNKAIKLTSADMPERADEGQIVEKKPAKAKDEASDEDQEVLETLEEHLSVLTGFSDDEIGELSEKDLDGLIALCDEFIDEEAKAGGHGGHAGAHGGHGGGGAMGPMAKKGARKRVMGKLETRRSQVLTDIRNMRTMKLTSPRSAELRKEMIQGAQTELSGIRKKMITARAKYKSGAIKMCSWEDVRQEASHMIEQQLAAAVPFGDQPGYCYVEGTYSDHIVCCICKAGMERHYSVPFELDDDGHVAKLGSPTEVEKGDWKPVEHPMENIPMGLHASMAKTYVSSLLERTKDLLERRTKEGRVLSMATRKRLMECSEAMRGACEEIDTLLASTEPTAKAGDVQLRLKVLKLFAATL